MNNPFSSHILRIGALALFCLLASCHAGAIGQERYVETSHKQSDFSIVEKKMATPLYVDSGDYPGVIRAAKDLQADIERVTNCSATFISDEKNLGKNAIIIGALGKSP